MEGSGPAFADHGRKTQNIVPVLINKSIGFLLSPKSDAYFVDSHSLLFHFPKFSKENIFDELVHVFKPVYL